MLQISVGWALSILARKVVAHYLPMMSLKGENLWSFRCWSIFSSKIIGNSEQFSPPGARLNLIMKGYGSCNSYWLWKSGWFCYHSYSMAWPFPNNEVLESTVVCQWAPDMVFICSRARMKWWFLQPYLLKKIQSLDSQIDTWRKICDFLFNFVRVVF